LPQEFHPNLYFLVNLYFYPGDNASMFSWQSQTTRAFARPETIFADAAKNLARRLLGTADSSHPSKELTSEQPLFSADIKKERPVCTARGKRMWGPEGLT
jgi:hypothetical protein